MVSNPQTPVELARTPSRRSPPGSLDPRCPAFDACRSAVICSSRARGRFHEHLVPTRSPELLPLSTPGTLRTLLFFRCCYPDMPTLALTWGLVMIGLGFSCMCVPDARTSPRLRTETRVPAGCMGLVAPRFSCTISCIRKTDFLFAFSYVHRRAGPASSKLMIPRVFRRQWYGF
jgi:hypothetical protein